jgi:hypothetical protein
MRKSLIVVSSALLFAVAAAGPGGPKLGFDLEVFEGGRFDELAGGAPAPVHAAAYPPCRSRGQDRCIQLYERRVALAHARRGGSQVPARAAPMAAIGGPIESRSDYPRCSRVLTDECVQHFDSQPTAARNRRTPERDGPSTPGI